MNDFKVIYRILKYLSAAMDGGEYDPEALSSARLKASDERIEQLLIMLQEAGYIQGLTVSRSLGDSYPHISSGSFPRITLKGLEYLAENSMMKKAGNTLRGIVDVGGTLKP